MAFPPMPPCHKLLMLQAAAAVVSLRSRWILEESARLPAVTGFSPETILDLTGRSLAARKRACAALASHSELHGCAPANCDWPAPNCHACSLRGSWRVTTAT